MQFARPNMDRRRLNIDCRVTSILRIGERIGIGVAGNVYPAVQLLMSPRHAEITSHHEAIVPNLPKYSVLFCASYKHFF